MFMSISCANALLSHLPSLSPNKTQVTGGVLERCLVVIDLETEGLDPTQGNIICGTMVVVKVGVYEAQQYFFKGPCQLTFDNCLMVAFQTSFERAWLEPNCVDCLWLDVRTPYNRTGNGMVYGTLAQYVERVFDKKLLKGVRDELIAKTNANTLDQEFIDKEVLPYCWGDTLWTYALLTHEVPTWLSITDMTNVFGSILCGSLKVHLHDFDVWRKDCEDIYQYRLQKLSNDLREELDNLLSMEGMTHLPRTKVDLARVVPLIEATLVERFPRWTQRLGWRKVRDKLTKQKETISLKSELIAYVAGVCWREGDDLHDVYKEEDGWKWNGQPLLDKKGQPVKGHTPFTKDALYSDVLDDGSTTDGLTSQHPTLGVFLRETAFWLSIRTRTEALAHYPTPGNTWNHQGTLTVHYPQPQVNGTFTGRSIDPFWLVLANPKPNKLGSDIKTRLSCKSGNVLVRMDFDSQEARLAQYVNSWYGYRNWGWEPRYDNNEYALAELFGNKKDKTDTHSLLAQKTGLSRDQAKNVYYAMQFGAGLERLMLMGMSREAAQLALDGLKGKKEYMLNSWGELDREFRGGLLSGYFSYNLRERPERPHTLIFNSLSPSGTPKDKVTTLNNYPIQGTGTDMRDILLSQTYLQCRQQGIPFQLAMVLHDEFVWEVPHHLANQLCDIICLSHKMVYEQLNLSLFGHTNVPTQHAYPEGIEVYSHWRKDIVGTPSLQNPHIFSEGYVYTHSL